MKRRLAVLFAILVLALSGCYVPSPKPGKTAILQQKVGLAGAGTVSASITIGVGRLVVEQPPRVVAATWPGNVRYDWNLRLDSGVPLELEVDMGVGKSELDLRGLDVRRLSLKAGVGAGSVDLSGPRTSDLDATIKAGVGRLTLILPDDVGVRVKTQGGLGHVSAEGLKTRDDAWVNESWGKTKASLRVEVEGGIGKVEMRLAGPSAGDST